MGPILRTPEEGADTIVWLAAHEDAISANGRFWHDRAVRPTDRLPTTTFDTDTRRDLWHLLDATASTIHTEMEHIA